MDLIVDLPASQGHGIVLAVGKHLQGSWFNSNKRMPPAPWSTHLVLQDSFQCHGLPWAVWRWMKTPSSLLSFWAFWGATICKPLHPQSNNQTKQVNQILKQYSCCYVNCCGWLGLPATTGKICLQQLSSKQQTSLYKQRGFQSHDQVAMLGQFSRSFALRTLVWWLQHTHFFPSEQLEKVQTAYKGYVNRNLDFRAGDWVCLSHDIQFNLLIYWTPLLGPI